MGLNFVINNDSSKPLDLSLWHTNDTINWDNIFLLIRNIMDKNPKLKLARKISIIAYSILFILGALANLIVLKSLFPTFLNNKTIFSNKRAKQIEQVERSRRKHNYFRTHSFPLKHASSHPKLDLAIFRDIAIISSPHCVTKPPAMLNSPYVISFSNFGVEKYDPSYFKFEPKDKPNYNTRRINLKRSKTTNSMTYLRPNITSIQKNHYRFNLQSRVRLLILHLCLADLLVIFLVAPLEIGWSATISWRAGNMACKIFAFFRIFGLYLSSLILIVISIDRCYTICNPMKFNQNFFVKGMITGAWLISILASLPQVLYI
ncbi:unnamed protein product [Gordionus sp. m RMFG-2023]